CLSASEVALLAAGAPCTETCWVPSMISGTGPVVNTTLKICNYATTPQTYAWSLAGLPAGPGCAVNGPTVFSPGMGTVTLPAATSGPSCVTIPITITYPPGILYMQTACYQATVQNTATGRCIA